MDKGKNHKQGFSETETYTAPKWKRLERKQNHKEQEVLHSTSLRRSGLEIKGHEHSNKQRQVYHEDQDNIFVLAEVVSLPTRNNESPMLELLWDWEPTDKSGAWRFDPGTRSLSRVFNRNMA